MFDEILDFIKATEATEEDLKNLEFFDCIPSQLVDLISSAAQKCNGGVTGTTVTLEWVVGQNYQEERFAQLGELVPGDTITVKGRFQYWEFCRKNDKGEVIAFVRLRCGQLKHLWKIQRFV